MTKPLYFYNGTTFELVGPTTPQSPIAYQTSAPTAPATGDIWIDSDGDVDTYNRQLTRYYFVATAGQTSVSGVDANGLTLAYVAGSEQVYVNGALQVRGQDYTATNGTSITNLSALALNDVVEIFAYTAFTVANAYTKTETDGVAAAATGARLVIPTSVAVGSGTGSVDANGAVTFSAASSVSLNGCFSATYDNYLIIPDNITQSASSYMQLRLRTSGTDNTANSYWRQYILPTSTTVSAARTQGTSLDLWEAGATFPAGGQMFIQNPFATAYTRANYFVNQENPTTQGFIQGSFTFNGTTSFDGFTLIAASGTISGSVRVYGFKN